MSAYMLYLGTLQKKKEKRFGVQLNGQLMHAKRPRPSIITVPQPEARTNIKNIIAVCHNSLKKTHIYIVWDPLTVIFWFCIYNVRIKCNNNKINANKLASLALLSREQRQRPLVDWVTYVSKPSPLLSVGFVSLRQANTVQRRFVWNSRTCQKSQRRHGEKRAQRCGLHCHVFKFPPCRFLLELA